MPRLMSLLLLVVAVGCESSNGPASVSPADHSYTTRGMVERMQLRNDDRILILHEAIPDFIGIDGKPAPMAPMAMPFALADGVLMKDDVGALGVGAKVEFSFEVRWEAGEPLTITKIARLAPGVKIVLVN